MNLYQKYSICSKEESGKSENLNLASSSQNKANESENLVTGYAKPTGILEYFVRRNVNFGLHYLAPNELNVKDAQTIFKSAPSGVYVGVGTERCLVAPALNPGITHVFMVDSDPVVRLFNSINIAVIKASPDRETCKNLRFTESFEEFANILKNVGYRTEEKRPDLLNPNIYEFYKKSLFQWSERRSIFYNYMNSDNTELFIYYRAPLKTYESKL